MTWHEDHTGDEFEQEYLTYGDLDDKDRPYADDAKEDDSWEEDSDTEFLSRCCGEARPLHKRGMVLIVTPTAGKDFVTVHDYVSGESSFCEFVVFCLMMGIAVHLWLMDLRKFIL